LKSAHPLSRGTLSQHSGNIFLSWLCPENTFSTHSTVTCTSKFSSCTYTKYIVTHLYYILLYNTYPRSLEAINFHTKNIPKQVSFCSLMNDSTWSWVLAVCHKEIFLPLTDCSINMASILLFTQIIIIQMVPPA
jgi:hypothetical protein